MIVFSAPLRGYGEAISASQERERGRKKPAEAASVFTEPGKNHPRAAGFAKASRLASHDTPRVGFTFFNKTHSENGASCSPP